MKTKTKKKLKRVHHVVTKKKLVKKKTSRRVLRGFFISVVMVCTSGLAFAIATTRPTTSVEVHTKIKPGTQLIVEQTADPVRTTRATQTGIASWYAIGLPAPDALTCASTRFGRGTYLFVTNRQNGRTVTCLVNDYGPEAWTHRVIDLSRGSFRVIANLGQGTVPVEVRPVSKPPASYFSVPLPSLSSVLGYNLCHKHHTGDFCEQNRQEVAN